MPNSRERKLQKSQDLYRLLVEEIRDCAIFVLDTHGTVITWNLGAEKLMGYKAEEILGKHFSCLFTQKSVQQGKPMAELEEARAKGSLQVEEWRVRKDGSLFWADVLITPLYIPAGRHFGYAKILRDLTQRRKTEERLRLSIRAFKALSACNQIIIRATDEKKLVEDMCRTIHEIAEYPAVWMGFFDRERSVIKPVAWAGGGEKMAKTHPLLEIRGQGGAGWPFQKAIATAKPVVIQNLTTHPNIPWKEAVLKEGYASLVIFPLTVEEGPLGILAIYSPEPEAFNPEEVALLSEVANDLAFGITTIRHRIQREEALKTLLEKERQANKHQEALLALSRMESRGEISFKEITEKASHTLEVERVSIWFYGEDRTKLICQDLYARSKGIHEKGQRLSPREYPQYFDALKEGRVIDAHDAQEDPRTKELNQDYLKPLGIVSMLDAPIRVKGKVVGVLCIEETKAKRTWSAEDIAFAASLADLVALHLEHEEKERAEQEREKLLVAIEQASDSIVITDTKGKIIYANRAVQEISGYSLQELMGSHVKIWRSGKHDQTFYQNLWETILSGEPFRAVFTNRRKDGETFMLDQTITPIRNGAGEIYLFVATGKDITQEKILEDRLHYLAYYDALTGLPNKVLFLERVEHAFSNLPSHKLAVIIIVNISRFRRINDIYGYETGSRILKEMAGRLKGIGGTENITARIGGSEFGLFIGNLNHVEEVVPILQSILKSTSKVEVNGKEITLEINMGISVFPQDAKDARDLTAKARIALSETKSRNTPYQFYSKEAEEKVREFSIIERKLSQATERQEFTLHYQPYFELATGNMVGMESLLRWNTPEGIVSAGRYIPILEETGMIHHVGEWVFRRACQQILEWTAEGYSPVPLSVNISPVQFSHREFVDTIGGIIRESKVDPQLLIAEITESTFMKDVEYTREVLKTLKDWGMSVSIDDFGTGYSSLSYLKRLPIDSLKIDISFIREITQDPDDASIVSAIISLAHNLGLKTIAEGVETEEQWRFLHLLRCDMVQGFHCGKPMSAQEVVKKFPI